VTLPRLDTFHATDFHGALYTVSLQIALYTREPPAALAAGATTCLRLFTDRYGAHVRLFHRYPMRKPKPFARRQIAELGKVIRTTDDDGLPSFRVWNGHNLSDYRAPVFATGSYSDYSWLQVQVPPEAAEDWKLLHALLGALGAAFPFRCGHVGLALCWNDLSVDRDIEVPRLIGPHLKRYPGFTSATPEELCDQDPLPPVNWLTLLGPAVVKPLGGIAAIRKKLASTKSISVMPLGKGVLIRAGDLPQLGDTKRGDDLPLYRKVGAYLRKYRGTQTIELDGLSERGSKAWLARFDA